MHPALQFVFTIIIDVGTDAVLALIAHSFIEVCEGILLCSDIRMLVTEVLATQLYEIWRLVFFLRFAFAAD